MISPDLVIRGGSDIHNCRCIQADTVRPATNPIFSQGRLGIKPGPQILRRAKQSASSLSAQPPFFTFTIIEMCKHEMYVILSRLQFYPRLTSTFLALVISTGAVGYVCSSFFLCLDIQQSRIFLIAFPWPVLHWDNPGLFF
jgi:hypothetical protein